jgi:hypothetical protein
VESIFRFNRHRDDRSNVAGSAIEPVVGFSGVAWFRRLQFACFRQHEYQRQRSDAIAKHDSSTNSAKSEASHAHLCWIPSNPSTFAPAGTRWLNEANYTELDF